MMRTHKMIQWCVGVVVCWALLGWPAGIAAGDLGPGIAAEASAPLSPTQVARIHADGTRGPWMNYENPSEPTQTDDARPIWDSYTQCVYDIPPGSRQFCPGECEGVRYYTPGPVCMHSMGGDLPDNPPPTATAMTFVWGLLQAIPVLEVEFLIYDTFDGDECTDPGSHFISGLVGRFEEPSEGFFYTEVDLRGHGLEMEMPRTGRIGIQTIYWRDRDNRQFSNEALPGLWFTKTGWEHVIGGQDEKWFDDRQDPNCQLDANDCLTGQKPCPVNEYGLVQSLLLLGGQDDTCIYRLTKDARPKGGCLRCPQKHDFIGNERPCNELPDCPLKLGIRKSPCLEGPNGFCAKLKGKRDRCGSLP